MTRYLAIAACAAGCVVGSGVSPTPPQDTVETFRFGDRPAFREAWTTTDFQPHWDRPPADRLGLSAACTQRALQTRVFMVAGLVPHCAGLLETRGCTRRNGGWIELVVAGDRRDSEGDIRHITEKNVIHTALHEASHVALRCEGVPGPEHHGIMQPLGL